MGAGRIIVVDTDMIPSVLLLFSALSGAPQGASDADPAARVLEAALHRRSLGDLPGTAAVLVPRPIDGKLQSCGGPLEPWCVLVRAQALFYQGDYEAAAEGFAEARALDPDGPAGLRALRSMGEALMRAGDQPAAIRALTQAINRRPMPELYLSLAEAEQRRGDTAKAADALRRIYVEFPDHPAAREAARRLRSLGRLSSMAADTLLARASRLLELGMGKAALSASQRALLASRDPAVRAAAQLSIGKALFALKEYPLAETTLAAIEEKAPSAIVAQAKLLSGRSALSRGDQAEAARRFDALVEALPREAASDEAAFLAAWSFYNAGDYRTCAERFSRLAGSNGSPRSAESLWYQGFCSHLTGDDEAAQRAWTLLTRTALSNQAHYWLGRLAKDPKEAAAHFQSVVQAAPFDWYAWLARGKLAELNQPAPALGPADVPSCDQPTTRRQRAAALLARVGLAQQAREELQADATNAKEAARDAAFASCLGIYDVSYRLANRFLWRAAIAQDGSASGSLFPRAYPELVNRAAGAIGFDPSFVWAIMRRESAFDPVARSSARAYGLMQLLRSVARKIAMLSAAPPPEVEDLQNPERIVPLASWYLKQLTTRFGHAALAAAAYNGGATAAAQWVAARGNRPLDEFVELIPYKETRLYVKGVLGDYFTYRALWRADGPALPFPMSIPPAGPGVDF